MSQPDYKDTVRSWLGDVPTSWQVRRLKTVISQPITDGPHETPEFLSEGIPFLSVDGIQNGDLVFDGCRYISQAAHKEYQRKCAPCYNDILLGKAASTGKIARVKVDFDFSIWSPLALIRPNQSEMRPDFLEYSLKSVATQAQIDCLCTANTQKNISMQDIPSLVLCVPPFQNQINIAAYLNEQTAKIDQLMEMRRRQMALLKEQRAAMIQEAVTRGLNPNVPMKDSGLPWLGEIPAHWDVKSVKFAARILRGRFGHRPRTDPLLYDGPYPFVQTGDVATAKKYLSSYKQTLNEKGYGVSVEFPAGTLLMAIAANIGDLAILGINACLPDSIVGFFPYTGIDVEFLYYQLSCMQIRLHALAPENTQMNLNIDRLSPEKIVVPPYEEQKEICRLINESEANIESALSAYTRQLTLLTEYRAALIHECVTGQRSVPETSNA